MELHELSERYAIGYDMSKYAEFASGEFVDVSLIRDFTRRYNLRGDINYKIDWNEYLQYLKTHPILTTNATLSDLNPDIIDKFNNTYSHLFNLDSYTVRAYINLPSGERILRYEEVIPFDYENMVPYSLTETFIASEDELDNFLKEW